MRKKLPASIMGLALISASCGLSTDSETVLRPDADGEIIIDMDEFSFGVDRIEVTAGQTVTFVIVNAGDNEHEFMVGRDLMDTSEGYANGFEHDFFESTTPVVEPPNAGMFMGAGMDMDGMDMDMDMDMGHDEDDDGDVHAGFMVERLPGEVARVTIVVPLSALGDWDVGCFRGRGAHWDAGMRASLTVLAA